MEKALLENARISVSLVKKKVNLVWTLEGSLPIFGVQVMQVSPAQSLLSVEARYLADPMNTTETWSLCPWWLVLKSQEVTFPLAPGDPGLGLSLESTTNDNISTSMGHTVIPCSKSKTSHLEQDILGVLFP